MKRNKQLLYLLSFFFGLHHSSSLAMKVQSPVKVIVRYLIKKNLGTDFGKKIKNSYKSDFTNNGLLKTPEQLQTGLYENPSLFKAQVEENYGKVFSQMEKISLVKTIKRYRDISRVKFSNDEKLFGVTESDHGVFSTQNGSEKQLNPWGFDSVSSDGVFFIFSYGGTPCRKKIYDTRSSQDVLELDRVIEIDFSNDDKFCLVRFANNDDGSRCTKLYKTHDWTCIKEFNRCCVLSPDGEYVLINGQNDPYELTRLPELGVNWGIGNYTHCKFGPDGRTIFGYEKISDTEVKAVAYCLDGVGHLLQLPFFVKRGCYEMGPWPYCLKLDRFKKDKNYEGLYVVDDFKRDIAVVDAYLKKVLFSGSDPIALDHRGRLSIYKNGNSVKTLVDVRDFKISECGIFLLVTFGKHPSEECTSIYETENFSRIVSEASNIGGIVTSPTGNHVVVWEEEEIKKVINIYKTNPLL